MNQNLPSFNEYGRASLQPEQVQEFKRWISLLGMSGPLVGAYVSEDGEDVRALVLQGAYTFLVRSLSIQKLSSHLADQYLQIFKTLTVDSGESLIAHDGGALLYGRRFFGEEDFLHTDHPCIDQLPGDLVEHLGEFITAGIFHGHLVPQNVVFNGQQWKLLDAGLWFVSERKIVPGESFEAYQRTGYERDLASLGEVLEEYSGKMARDELADLFRQMQSSVVGERPSWSAVCDAISSQSDSLKSADLPSVEDEDSVLTPSHKSAPSFEGSPLTLFVGLVLVIALAVLGYDDAREWWLSSPSEDLKADWLSEDRERMVPVAMSAALDRDSTARNVILRELLNGYGEDLVLAEPLIIGHEPPWADLIPVEGRRALYVYALAPILQGEIDAIPALHEVHVGVLFALTAGLSAGKSRVRIAKELQRRSDELPSPYREAVEELSSDGTSSLLPNLTRMMMGHFTKESILQFFPPDLSFDELLKRLRAIGPTLNETEADALWAFLVEKGNVGQSLGNWFSQNPLAGWGRVTAAQKMFAATGQLTVAPLQLEQYADLLRFPSAEIQEKVPAVIDDRFFRDKRILQVLSVLQVEETLSRGQVASLVAALALTGESAHAFIDQWFSTKPEPSTVLRILLARAEYEDGDPLSISAARYLRQHRGWDATIEQLRIMANHPEPLARGLAYTKLSIEDSEAITILTERATVEKMPSLQKLLVSKLERVVEQAP